MPAVMTPAVVMPAVVMMPAVAGIVGVVTVPITRVDVFIWPVRRVVTRTRVGTAGATAGGANHCQNKCEEQKLFHLQPPFWDVGAIYRHPV